MSKQTLNHLESNVLRILIGNFLISSLLILNIITLLSTLWTITKFDLLKETRINKFISQRDNPLSLIFTKDITVDNLIAESSISFSKLRAKEISISAGPQLDQSGIYMVQETTIMQAQEFKIGSESIDSADDFGLPSQLRIVEIPNGLNDVSAIKSIIEHDCGQNDKLSVTSKGSLNLSGNRGLTISGKEFNIISGYKINLRSRWENLLMLAKKGVCLPNLTSEGELSKSSKYEPEKRMNICVEKSSGLINYCQLDR